jgi:putative peptide zinc metalloprotease protein
MGIMLVVFTPMPYVDASASWGFRYRWQRVMVGAAGMLAEFALGAVAVMVWAWSAPGALHAIAYNTIFITTVTTILFNINPLLRFDGYYILTDLLNLPNLYQRAREQLRLVTETALFGLEPSLALDRSPLGKWLLWYGLLSLLYWGVVITSIILFVADQYLDLGIMMALFMVVTALVLPLFRLVGFLLFSPRLVWHRGRAILVSLLLLSTVGGLLAGIPVPERIRAPGVLEAIHFRELNSEVSGLVVELLAKPGDTVTAHQPLVRMEMPELELEWQAAEQQKVQVLAQIRQAEHALVADLAPLRDQLQAVEEALQALQRKRASLSVSAPIAGLWSAPEIESALGRWMARGSSLGNIIDPQGFRFVAVLPQVATHLFDSVPEEGEIRLHGQENINLLASHIRIVPFQHGILPSPALGWAGGGEIDVEANNPIQAIEPFFLLYALLTPEPPAELRLLHGRSGTLRVTLGSRPLLWQWERSLRQFFQQKYRL